MYQVERQTISALNQTRNQLSAMQLDDKETIIQSGAALEAVYEEIPEDIENVREALVQCLYALQAIYQEAMADSERGLKAVLGALIASEQVLGGPPNPITDLMLTQAMTSLRTELDTAAHASGESAPPPPLETLDDVASYLIQIEPADTRAVELICEALKNISVTVADKNKRKLVVKAARELAKIVAGKCNDSDAAVKMVGELIEQAGADGDEFAAPDVEPMSETKPAAETKKAVAAPPTATPSESAEKASSDPSEENVEGDVLPPDSDASLVSEFVIESHELLEAAEGALLLLETDPNDVENVNTVFRAFHTVKGSAAYLGLKRLTELAHHAESLLSRMRDREIVCSGGYATLALRSLDVLKEMLNGVERTPLNSVIALPKTYGELMTILKNPEANGVSAESGAPAKVKATPVKADAPEESVSLEKIVEEAMPALVGGNGTANAFAGQEDPVSKKSQSADSSVRVRTDRLDRLIDMVGELVIAQSMLAQDATVMAGAHHDLSRKISHAGKIVRELQDLSMGMRMIPLKNTFQKMARLVRDVANKCGKQVEFQTDGEDTEIDRNMVDLIADPLIHMVRNAVDHGIETPGVRAEAGKSATGRVKLAAYHAGGDVVVELTDDGAGLDPEKLVAKAIAKNLIESDKGMSESEIFRLIFAPGFSTAEALTDVSGRGVGMDVVRRNIEAMRGRIEIASEKGKGSVFTIRLPLTLAITDGMLVRVGSERYIVPTVNIQLSFQPNQKMLSSVTGRGELVSLRGELMPVFRLHQLFEVMDAVEDPTAGLLMIVADGRRRCALLVDELLGQQQVVTKTLGQGIGKIAGVSGGAILGDGCVGLILDTAEIVALARQASGPIDRKEDPNKQQAA